MMRTGRIRRNLVLVGEAIGQVLSFGVGVALSPVPIIGVVLMLGTPSRGVICLLIDAKLIGDAISGFSG